MYAYGHTETEMAYALLKNMGIKSDACNGCDVCRVKCSKKFNIKTKLPTSQVLLMYRQILLPDLRAHQDIFSRYLWMFSGKQQDLRLNRRTEGKQNFYNYFPFVS